MKVGIDLGTTYSVVARYDSGTASTVIVRNKYLKDLTPSVVCFLNDGSVIVGEEAKDLQKNGAGTIAALFKVDMGSKDVCAEINGRRYNAENLSELLLRELVKDAEATSGEKIESAVITVPAYFDDTQRTSTRAAAEAAGIKVSKIINEPTAAAVYYGYKRSEGRTTLVYDLGGGTFDVTVVKTSGGSIEVLGTNGNHDLGGKDWDEALMNIACDRFADEFGLDPREDVHKRLELMANAEDYKKLLSRTSTVNFAVSYAGKSGKYAITREEFEAATEYLVEATSEVLDALYEDISLEYTDIDEVLLCGGSTRLPRITEFLKESGYRKIVSHKDTDLAVAKGAAIVASFYSDEEGRADGISFTDVTAHSLGVLSIDPDLGVYTNNILINSNTKIPCSVTKPFRIEENNFTDQVEIYMLQGESPVPSDCTVVRREVITGFDNIGKSMVIDVTYSYSDEGVVTVSASRNGSPLTVIEESIPEDMSWISLPPKEKKSNKMVAKSIVFCIDLSRSMKKSLETVKTTVKSYIIGLSGGFTRFGLVGFGDRRKVLCDLTQEQDEIFQAVEAMEVNKLGRGTDASPLSLAREMLTDEKGAKIIFVFTDGIWGNRDAAVDEARECRDEMINVLAYGIGDADISFIKQIATIEEGAIYTTVNNLGKTINTIATAINESPTGFMELLR